MNLKLSKSKILIAGLCATLAVVAFASTALAYTEDAWQTTPYADLRIDGSTTCWPTISGSTQYFHRRRYFHHQPFPGLC